MFAAFQHSISQTISRSHSFTLIRPHKNRVVASRDRRKERTGISAANNSNGAGSQNDEIDWAKTAFPSYMASKSTQYCSDFEDALAEAENNGKVPQMSPEERRLNTVWTAIRREAAKAAAEEPMLSSFLYASIMAHDTLERALAFVLANRLANTTMLPTQLLDLFYQIITTDPATRSGALADIEAFRERDPACSSYSQALLYYKGFHAIQTHRIAHALWNRGQRIMALALQSRMSEVLAVDIHPAAKIGKGLLLDHGTGVVIGETAVIGNNVSLLQNVTLGGTGKEVGDRHPKLSDNVLVGANATILGNISIGRGAQVAAGSLVLKPVPPNTIMAGTPAKEVGKVRDHTAISLEQTTVSRRDKYMQSDPFLEEDLGNGAANGARAPAAAVPGKSVGETKTEEKAAPAPEAQSSAPTTATTGSTIPATTTIPPTTNSSTTSSSQSATSPATTSPSPTTGASSTPSSKSNEPSPSAVEVSPAILRVKRQLGSTKASTPLEGKPSEHVQHTRDDKEAARLWKNSSAEPEYFI